MLLNKTQSRGLKISPVVYFYLIMRLHFKFAAIPHNLHPSTFHCFYLINLSFTTTTSFRLLNRCMCVCSTAGPVPLSVYQRLKKLEDRILELEGLSPEYFQSTVSLVALDRIHKRHLIILVI